MAEIIVYSSALCPFCHRAKQLLKQKGVTWHEIDVMMKPERKKEMMARANGDHKVPQIFIDGEHIGGCDELYALDRAGGLDPKLQDTPS